MKLKNQFIIDKILIFTLCVLTIISKGNAQAIFPVIPDKINPKAKFLFYLHGRIVETKGIRPISERYGAYEYEKIIEALKNRGFIVISEARGRNTHAGEYAQKLVSQVNRLLDADVPPANITVVGASKGAFIAMIVSTMLQNKEELSQKIDVSITYICEVEQGKYKPNCDFLEYISRVLNVNLY